MAALELLAKRLEKLLGSATVAAGTEACQRYRFDGLCPNVVARPKEVGQIVEVLKLAAEMKASVIPRGNGTSMTVGRPPASADILLDLSNLNAIVEHDVPNLTLTCQAGIPLGSLYGAASKAGQLFPLDPPRAPVRTAGGTVATSSSGPFRMGYGSLKDLVLSVTAVLASGILVRFGAKVIKDVAGFNLGKLFIGSLGTLGVITELTFRLAGRPEEEKSVVAGFGDPAQPAMALTGIVSSPLTPWALELLTGEAGALLSQDVTGAVVLVAFAGLKEEVSRQIKETEDICYRAGAKYIESLNGNDHKRIWEKIRDLPFSLGNAEERLVIRVSTLITQVEPVMRLLRTLASEAGLESVTWAHAGTGTVFLLARGRTCQAMARVITKARERLGIISGAVIVDQAPLAVRKEVCPWGPPPPSFALMVKIKEALDPGRLLNPGRFVGGI